MVSSVVDLYNGEILYSLMARYHHRSGNVDFKDTLMELFGSDSVIPTIEFPTRLEAVAQNLTNPMYQAEYLLNNHTLFPIYAPFLPSTRADEIKNIMLNGSGEGIYTKIGYVAGGLCRNGSIKYCPLCVKEDIEQFGESFFRTVHQLQGIHVCPEHGCLLKDYPITKKDSSRVEFIRLDAGLVSLDEVNETDAIMLEHQKSIARAAAYLVESPPGVNLEKVYELYRKWLDNKGFITGNGRVRQRELYEEFKDYYGENLLRAMESVIDSQAGWNWLQSISRKPRKVIHPIRHIMFILYLSGSMEAFFECEAINDKPFGSNPWPCYNPEADHYMQPVVYDCTVTVDSKTREPVGTFTCSCGFVYATKGLGGRICIKQFGTVWEDKLRELILGGIHGLRELARSMKCDPKTIIRHAERLGLLHLVNTQKRLPVEQEVRPDIGCVEEQYKGDVTEFIKANPNLTRTQVRASLQKQYSYLYKHDRDWLNANLPPCIPRGQRNQARAKRVDWEKRDSEVFQEIRKLSDELLLKEEPIRITKSILGWKSGKSALLQHKLDKLPKTRNLLTRITETVDDYQVRRVEKVGQVLAENCALKKWKLVRVAGLRPGYSKRVNELIKTYSGS